MGLINNPAFLDRDLGSTNGLFVRFGVANPKITAITCIGEITVSSIVAGEVVETTYTDLESAQLDIQADANTTVRIVGDVTQLVLNEERATFLDLRALRSLRSLTLHQNTATFTLNLAGCRKLQTLDLSDCWLLRSLDLSQNTQLESLNLAGCRDLQSLDLSANKFLLYVDLTDCRSLSYLDVTMLTNLEELKIDGTQLQSPGNNLIITKAIGGGGSVPQGVAMEETSQKILTQVRTVTAIDPDIRAGKEAIALQIIRKGIPSSPTDTLMSMADQVRSISQNPITFEGAAEYEAQMFGAPTTTTTAYTQDGPLWNLYKVMTDLLNDGRFTEYGGILLAEYYKGYDTIELMNVGAGGAYFTSDLQFYTEDKTGDNAHVWNDADNGMANRWVAYLFAAPSTNYTIPSTLLCPRSIHIGRHVGTITCTFEGRISEIVVSDLVDENGTQLNVLDGTNFTSTQNWGKVVNIRNTRSYSGYLLYNTSAVEIYINDKVEQITNIAFAGNSGGSQLNTIILPNCKRITYTICNFRYLPSSMRIVFAKGATASFGEWGIISPTTTASYTYPSKLTIEGLVSADMIFRALYSYGLHTYLQELYLPDYTSGNIFDHFGGSYHTEKLWKIEIPSFVGGTLSVNRGYALLDILVGECNNSINATQWIPEYVLADETKTNTLLDNILHHIAEKVQDRTDLSALTISFSSGIKTAINNQESQAVANAFTAKNWIIA